MFLAIREIRHSRGKYVLIAVIMLLISYLVLFVTGLAQGLAYANISALENMKATRFAVQDTAEGRFRSSELGEAELGAIRQTSGVRDADYLGVQASSVSVGAEGTKLDVTFFGVDMEGGLSPFIKEGVPLTNLSEGMVIADSKLKSKGLALGDKLTDSQSGLVFEVRGFTENSSYSHMPVLYMNGQDWMRMKSSGGRAYEGLAFNAIAFTADTNTVKKLEEYVPAVELLTKKQAIDSVPGYSAEQGSLKMMIAFLYVISAFVLSVFFYVLTVQKTAQFGILKAIGVKPGYLSWSVISQVLTLSAASLAISLGLTGATAASLPAAMPFHMDGQTMLLSGLLFLGVALAGALVSVWRVSRIDPLEAIGRAGA